MMGKLRARMPPITEMLEPETVLQVVQDLFPGRPDEPRPTGNWEQANEKVISPEEVARAAKRILIGKAP
ncbi:hypothetical protein M0804_014834 [Polistes exclamans]|nr:hypothetical protein M0804_014834 [Polistes exclamans]